ncbi:MAG: DNA polymerase I [Clostridiales bacterium]|nr:DNA polymerase I [Clostridiales bacterium]
MQQSTKPCILVVDGNSILNRAFYGIRPLTTKDGLFTQAVYGFTNIMLKHCAELAPAYAVTAFDLKGPTFRHKAYAEYKAGRKGMPEELAVQLPYAKECAKGLGFYVAEQEGYEADDLLGTFARMANERGVHAYLLTGDRDALQLVNENTTVLLASTGQTTAYTPAVFTEKYGVLSSQFVDVKALMGDASDHIPGVAGIGEKTALKLIADFHDLDNLLATYETADLSAGVKKKLAAGRDSALLSRDLATICTDVPVGLSLDDVAFTGYQTKKLTDLLKELELYSLLDRLSLEEQADAAEYCPASLDQVQKGKPYGLLLEEGYLYLAADEHVKISFDSLTDVRVLFEETDYRLIVHDAKSLWHQLDAEGIVFRSCAFDVSLAGYVLDTAAADYSVDRLAKTYLSMTSADEADLLYRLWENLSARMAETGVKELYEQIELPCAFVLAEMEKKGFKVDVDGLHAYSEELTQAAHVLAENIYLLAGEEFNINSPKQLGHILFDKLQIPTKKKTKTGYSTSAEVLEGLRPFYPIVDLVLEYRQLTKLNSTYAVGLSTAADEAGRVHTRFQQTVTATGRLSSVEPNLQNIPIKTEIGRVLRRYFVPENQDYVLVDADYSQIELRLLAHVANDPTMIQAFLDNVDIHALTAASAFGVPAAGVTAEMRKRAKAVNFGIVYGISDFALAQDLGVTKKQAKDYIDSYMRTYPGVADYLNNVVEQAKEDGYVTTLFGRRRYIPELSAGKAMLRSFGERVAMNSPIQGAAADMMKLAMVKVHKALQEANLDAAIILQVHDELVIEANRECASLAARILQTEMENVMSLSVPLVAQTSIGETWYENK